MKSMENNKIFIYLRTSVTYYNKEQNSLKAELQRRGCIRMEANSVLSDKHGNTIMAKSVQPEFMLDSIL